MSPGYRPVLPSTVPGVFAYKKIWVFLVGRTNFHPVFKLVFEHRVWTTDCEKSNENCFTGGYLSLILCQSVVPVERPGVVDL